MRRCELQGLPCRRYSETKTVRLCSFFSCARHIADKRSSTRATISAEDDEVDVDQEDEVQTSSCCSVFGEVLAEADIGLAPSCRNDVTLSLLLPLFLLLSLHEQQVYIEPFHQVAYLGCNIVSYVPASEHTGAQLNLCYLYRCRNPLMQLMHKGGMTAGKNLARLVGQHVRNVQPRLSSHILFAGNDNCSGHGPHITDLRRNGNSSRQRPGSPPGGCR